MCEYVASILHDKVCVPDAVYWELTDARTPEIVRRCVISLPTWLEVRTVEEIQTAFPVTLHRGEREAILLAETLRADVLLIDEQIGRTIALSRNLPLSGTLGVLERADTKGLVSDFPQILRRLKANGFFINEALESSSWNVTAHDEATRHRPFAAKSSRD